MEYVFEHANVNDVDAIWELIQDRIAWMDEKGIKQWNVFDYCEVFPITYYRSAVNQHQIYVLRNALDARVVAAAIVTNKDDSWDDDEDALYIHNFVSERNVAHVGKLFLDECCLMAHQQHKNFLRLDCAIDNVALNQYYERQGFLKKGRCEDGPYVGNLREKLVVVDNTLEI